VAGVVMALMQALVVIVMAFLLLARLVCLTGNVINMRVQGAGGTAYPIEQLYNHNQGISGSMGSTRETNL